MPIPIIKQLIFYNKKETNIHLSRTCRDLNCLSTRKFIKIKHMYKKIRPHIVLFTVAILLFSLYSCQSIPKRASVISNFNATRYMGSWYEIARIDFKFEKNLNNTTAHYSLKDNGDIKVINSGFNYVKNEWKKSEGNAKFRGDKDKGALKVSFFGPFYSGYNIYALDNDYKYALIGGKNYDYLWILSREKTIPNIIKEKYLKIAKEIGYDVNDLLWVEHDKNNPNVK